MTARRSVVTLGLVLAVVSAPVATDAQQTGRVPAVGFLFPASPAAARTQEEALQLGLRELGYVEGQSLTVERRYAEGSDDRLAAHAAELVRLKVDVIVAPASTAALAAKRATSAIPIVFASANDPVGVGLVSSLARPGHNVTGITPMSADLIAKRLELLKEAVPGLTRIAVLSASDYPRQGRQALVKEVETSARQLKLDVRVLEVGRRSDFDAAFSTMMKERVGAVTVLPIAFLTGERQRITELALRHRLPSIFQWKEYADAGGLMSYGASRTELMRRAASHVDKILKGAKPGDLPVEQATTFELIVNLKTAKALGLTIPPSILARATGVIE
jgi:putative ABC transport system substrate-binding protein